MGDGQRAHRRDRPSRFPLWRRMRSSWPLLRLWSVREYRAQYRQSALDVVWSLVSPITILAIYGFVLTRAFDVTGDGLPYASFAWAGLVVWTYFSGAVMGAVPSIIQEAGMITKVYFPREVIPLAVVGALTIELGISTVLLVVLALGQGIDLSVTVLALVPVFVVLLAWTAALSILGAAVTVFVRDVRQVVALVMRVGFIATPVMYPVTLLPDSVRWTASVNPAAALIEATRDSVLRGTWPDWPLLGAHAAVAGVLLVAGVAYTRSVEARMVDFV